MLQTTLDLPETSPLSALSADGLDLGHTFLLVSKQMSWHALALPEAEALAVCSAWIARTEMPVPAEFHARLSQLQTDAESRALRSRADGDCRYVWDDVVDAWIPLRRRTHPLHDITNTAVRAPKRRHSTALHAPIPKFPSELRESSDTDEIDFLNGTPALPARICRKPDTPYAGGRFPDFPFKGPSVHFQCKMYHPNVDDDGVLAAVAQLLREPNADDPMKPAVAEQYTSDRPVFEKTAREYTSAYATAAPA
ncbi:hypothetical protein MSPP1_003997 [Malassezia sp. CBS 17886]|nr:hypothetical protein MSPP1_003997 [Malassezia sp. CBS 17886]